MTEKSLPNRWLIASAGILMQLCLGTLYGWSIFANPLMTKHGWTNPQVTLAFTIAVGIIGLASAVGGYILDNKGARLVATFGGILFGLGIIITGLGDQMNSLPIIYLGYGVVAGIGLGFAYITPIATLVKWFPDKKGLISGLAVMGFGLGALIMTVLSPGMIASMGTSMTFYIFGAIFLVGVVGGAQWMIEPPAGYVPEGWTPPVKSGAASGMTLGEALASKYFYLLWAMLFVNVTAGMAVVSQAAPMARELLPATMTAAEKAKQAGLILGLFAIFNGVGRLFWASLSDKIGRRTVFTIMFASQAVAFYLLTTVNSITMFIILASYIYLCLGGGFATMPAYAADTYGTKYVGRIYGWKLTAWSAAGVVGPMLFSYIRQSSGNYSQAFFLTSIALAVALILPVLAAPAKEQA